VIAPQVEAALSTIEERAAVRGAPLFVANRDWVAYPERGRLVYQDEAGLLDLPSPRLIGRHQFTNAGTAIAALRRGGLGLPAAAIETGLATVDWPARMQRLTGGALVARLKAVNAEIWLDGGHNPSAGVVIAEAVADLEERAPRPLYLVTGMLTTKDPVGFFKPFAGLARHAYTVPVQASQAGREPGELAAAAVSAGVSAEAAGSVEEALDRIAADPKLEGPPRILICGSLYLAGSVLAQNGTPPK
jgi:dihydrofolate synthase/folylpolyglutamate synthase